jgi:glycosyltransferase involved in cell wall biosynthesis
MRPPLEGDFDVILPFLRWSERAEATRRSLQEQLGRPEALQVVEAHGDGEEGMAAWRVALDHLLRNPGRDLLVVAPGVLAPPLLDLRLRWSAYAEERVAVVSPLCDLDPVTSLARHGIAAASAADLDERIAGGPDAVVGAPYFLPECAYVRGDLIQKALAAEPPRDAAGLVRRLRREGLLLGLAPHVFVEAPSLASRRTPWLEDGSIGVFLAETPLHQVARRIGAAGEGAKAPGIRTRTRPRLLHVSHSLGGGLERWVEVFASGSSRVESFVLKSIGERGRFGSQLWLYESSRPLTPLRVWKLAPVIEGTAVSHLRYRQILAEIVAELGVDGVVVSSLIGHSLDALRSPVPTVVVLHDYYPFCPALHIFFDGVCGRCDEARLGECLDTNPLNNLFDHRDAREWRVVREGFLEALGGAGVKVVAPSPSVARHFQQLAPRMTGRIEVLPHGSDALDVWPEAEPPVEDSTAPLRVVVLGVVSAIKGEDLLREILDQSRDFARFWLVGCGERGRALAARHVEIVERYERPRLPEILAGVAADAGLFLSVVPETFSFTLDECLGAHIPPVAVRVGSFEDRIEDGVNGFLCDPSAASVVAQLRRLAADRGLLARPRSELRRRVPRSAGDMVADYARAFGLEDHSSRAYFASRWGQAGQAGQAAEEDGYRLPGGSPLGFSEFLRQVETGTLYHIEQTRRLSARKRAAARRAAAAGFQTARLLTRWLVR